MHGARRDTIYIYIANVCLENDQLGTRNIFRIRALGLKCCKLRELFCNLESILYKENFFLLVFVWYVY